MKSLRNFRIVLAALFFACCICYLFISPSFFTPAKIEEKVQIVPSAIAISLGAILVWLAMTFVFGRVYCSSVCPVGTMQDISFRIFGKLRKPGAYRSIKRYAPRIQVFWLYIFFLILAAFSVVEVAQLLEPWNLTKEIAFAVSPSARHAFTPAPFWLTLGIGASVGIAGGIVAALLIFICGALWGRDLCNMICPIGTALSAIAPYSVYHIEIDPDKCSNCMKCEQNCRAHAIKVLSRHVDNTRCVRCFDCVADCNDDAIRFQPNRNRQATPLMQRRKRTSI